jgi:pimeloyl-ACP methyl ester carboxylesterase
LDPTGDPVDLGDGITISTPGLNGDAENVLGSTGTRSTRVTAAAFDAALVEQDVQTLYTIEIEGATEQLGAPTPGMRATRFEEAAMVLDVPAVNGDWAQVVFMQDESGVITWNFAESAGNGPVVRGGGTQTFLLRRYVPPLDAQGETRRGLIGAIGTKIIKILAFPIQAIGGHIGTSLAQHWEAEHRPYDVRQVNPDTYSQAGAGIPLAVNDWHAFADRPVLLLVHGTFSRCSSTFGLIAKDVFARLYGVYGGRVVAFDHPTMTATPRENVEWLLGQIPVDGNVVVHALTHSRGGLVARTLAEKLTELVTLPSPHRVAVRTLVLVGAPDNGTALADAQHMSDFVDVFSNLINFFPDSVPLEVFQCIVAVVKEIAAGALDHLVGLQSMCPSGPFQRWLNTGKKDDSRYYAVASTFTPAQPGLREWAATRLMQAVFDGNANDLVVPTAGVYDRNGSSQFPIGVSARLLFEPNDGVNHCTYFQRAELHAKLETWLTGL